MVWVWVRSYPRLLYIYLFIPRQKRQGQQSKPRGPFFSKMMLSRFCFDRIPHCSSALQISLQAERRKYGHDKFGRKRMFLGKLQRSLEKGSRYVLGQVLFSFGSTKRPLIEVAHATLKNGMLDLVDQIRRDKNLRLQCERHNVLLRFSEGILEAFLCESIDQVY